MAWVNLTDRTGADPNASSDVDQLMEDIRILGGNGINAPDIDLQSLAGLSTDIHAITDDYVVLDNDGYGVILANPTNKAITITLPTAADNPNRSLTVIVSAVGGVVTIDGEGAEKIECGPYSLDTVQLQNKGDKLVIICDATNNKWYARELHTSLDTGWINRDDWTNVHLGNSVCAYDNLTGTFTIGEKITESTSGNTGVILSDSGSLLILKNVTGTGIWTDNRDLTGSHSGATAKVNYPGSTSKNVDSNLLHNFGVSIYNIIVKKMYSTDMTESNTLVIESSAGVAAGANVGCQEHGVDLNNIKLQSGSGGFLFLDDAGSADFIDTENYYFRAILKWVI